MTFISVIAGSQEALHLLEQSRVNLIICIKNRGESDSFQLTQTLRAKDITTPIIIISGEPNTAGMARDAGASLFVSGPTLISDLQRGLLQLLPP
jgi:CheY-like chemotaxis protein